jgi:hypothetical protein
MENNKCLKYKKTAGMCGIGNWNVTKQSGTLFS